MEPPPKYVERLKGCLPTATATLWLPQRLLIVTVTIPMFALPGLSLLAAGLWPLVVGLAARPAPNWSLLIVGAVFVACALVFWWLFQRGKGLLLTAVGIEWRAPLARPVSVTWSSIDAIEHRTMVLRAGVTNRLLLRVHAAPGAAATTRNLLCDSWPAPKDVLALVRAWWAHHRNPGGAIGPEPIVGEGDAAGRGHGGEVGRPS